MGMSLKPIQNDTNGHGYCGPVAMAALTGRRLSSCLDALRWAKYGDGWRRSFRENEGRVPAIRGVHNGTMAKALDHLGWRMRRVYCPTPMTIDKWCADRLADRFSTGGMSGKPRGSNDRFLFVIEWEENSRFESHYVAVRGRMALDTWTDGKPIPVPLFIHRANPVMEVWRVERYAS